MRRKGREFLSWGLRKKGTKKGNEQPSDEGTNDHDEGGGTSIGLDPPNLFGVLGNNDSFGDDGGADYWRAAASATASTAASTSVASTNAESTRGGTKWLSSALTAESNKKKTRAFTKPLQIA